MKPTTKLLLKGAYVLGGIGVLATISRAVARSFISDAFDALSSDTASTTPASSSSTTPASTTSASPSGTTPSMGQLPIRQLLTTHKFSEGRRAAITQIVMHTAGFSEVPNGARMLAEQLADTIKWTRDASWHYAVDNAEIVQSVLDENTAWHANEVNDWAIGIELVAREQYASEWHDAYSQAELDLAERLVAYLCRKYGIPVRRVTTEDLVLDKRTPGITGHDAVARAAGRTDRSDPGFNFPWDEFLQKVERYYAQGF